MGKLFGTDGVRGIANKELTPELAFKLGRASAHVLGAKDGNRPVFIIGTDTRISCDMLENAMSAGIISTGGNVIKVGILPTPAVAYLVKHFRADAGVVISASHNPFEYNGIKLFNSKGFKLDDNIENTIEDILLSEIGVDEHPTGERIGRCLEAETDGLKAYTDFLIENTDFRLDAMKLVLDCANGAAYEAAEQIYRQLGADVIMIGNEPDGMNINEACGSTHPEKLSEAVVKHGAQIGMAFDGDADRLIAVDENGKIIDGDRIICICASMLKKEGRLKNDIVTATIMSNIGFVKHMEALGCEVSLSNVGDRYVLEDMLKKGAILGGEQSGHIIFLDITTTGDGILSSLQFVRAIKKEGRPASEVAADIEIFPQVLRNATVKKDNKVRYSEDEQVNAAIEEVRNDIEAGGNGRILIRASGTEPLIRVMIEGSDLKYITGKAEYLADLIAEKLG